eukprot:1598088-Pyramimonas_sp.AAC.1
MCDYCVTRGFRRRAARVRKELVGELNSSVIEWLNKVLMAVWSPTERRCSWAPLRARESATRTKHRWRTHAPHIRGHLSHPTDETRAGLVCCCVVRRSFLTLQREPL